MLFADPYNTLHYCVNSGLAILSVVQDMSEQRQQSLQSLLAFMDLAVSQLTWLSEKEETEVSRDWSSQNLQIQELEDYHEVTGHLLQL